MFKLILSFFLEKVKIRKEFRFHALKWNSECFLILIKWKNQERNYALWGVLHDIKDVSTYDFSISGTECGSERIYYRVFFPYFLIFLKKGKGRVVISLWNAKTLSLFFKKTEKRKVSLFAPFSGKWKGALHLQAPFYLFSTRSYLPEEC